VALQSRVQPFLCSPDVMNEVQPRTAHVANVPDYYAEYRETGNGYAGFLGSSIAAKVRAFRYPIYASQCYSDRF